MPDTKLFKVGFEDGVMGTCAAVVFGMTYWLVPTWIQSLDGKSAKPERMIRLDQFRHQRFDPPATGPGPLAGADFFLNDPVPRELFVGELTPQLKARYVVLEKPDAIFQVPEIH